jgi:SpoIID/LytB domain protein
MRRIAVVACALALAPSAGATTFVVRGHGWGHGVGMSQWGARGLAEHGAGWRSILRHYYPGTGIGRFSPPRIRVLIKEDARRLAVSARSPFRIVDSRGRSRLQRRRIVFGRGRFHGLVPPLRVFQGMTPLIVDGAGYRGRLVIGRGISVINDVPLERYLRGVVPWEMPSRWHPEALRAQAVAARTYAYSRLGVGSFDVYADTRDQMYGGIRAEHPSTNVALGSTAGLIVTWQGRPARTYYFSTSGGRTVSALDGFGSAIPYLPSVSDPYDSGPKHDWSYRFTARQLARRLHVAPPTALQMRVNRSLRVTTVLVKRGGSVRRVDGRDFQRALDLPSTWFRVSGGAQPRRGATGRWVAILESGTTQFPGAVRSDAYPGLRPGLWVRVRGPFVTRDAAVVAAGSRGYVRHLSAPIG